jgi:hypothetical protein
VLSQADVYTQACMDMVHLAITRTTDKRNRSFPSSREAARVRVVLLAEK